MKWILLAICVLTSACGEGPLTPTPAPPGYDVNKPIVLPPGCVVIPFPPPPRAPYAYKLDCPPVNP